MKLTMLTFALASAASLYAQAPAGGPPQALPDGPPNGPENPRGPRPPRPMFGGPLMQALDTNKDGELSAEEIANAPAALKTLDKDGDGKVSKEELRPLAPLPPKDPRDPNGPKEEDGGRPGRPGKGQPRGAWNDGPRGEGREMAQRGEFRGNRPEASFAGSQAQGPQWQFRGPRPEEGSQAFHGEFQGRFFEGVISDGPREFRGPQPGDERRGGPQPEFRGPRPDGRPGPGQAGPRDGFRGPRGGQGDAPEHALGEFRGHHPEGPEAGPAPDDRRGARPDGAMPHRPDLFRGPRPEGAPLPPPPAPRVGQEGPPVPAGETPRAEAPPAPGAAAESETAPADRPQDEPSAPSAPEAPAPAAEQ